MYTKGEHGYFTGSEGQASARKNAKPYKGKETPKQIAENKRIFEEASVKDQKNALLPKRTKAQKIAAAMARTGETKAQVLARMGHKPNPKSFFEYQAATETPTLHDAVLRGAIDSKTTESQWAKLSPGMRREIVRSRKR